MGLLGAMPRVTSCEVVTLGQGCLVDAQGQGLRVGWADSADRPDKADVVTRCVCLPLSAEWRPHAAWTPSRLPIGKESLPYCQNVHTRTPGQPWGKPKRLFVTSGASLD